MGLDADEFVYEPEKMRDYLESHRPDFQVVRYYQMHQHKSEKPVDPKIPVFEQRRHGDMSLENYNQFYVKPNALRSGSKADWTVGFHYLKFKERNIKEGPQMWKGAHWHMADADLAIQRRMSIKNRYSKANIERGMGAHNHHITEGQIRRACKEHENDPRLF